MTNLTNMRAALHAAESGHWYSRDGRQVVEIDGRKPTLREARKHLLCPGVTTILGMANRHQLNVWREEQAMLAALTLPRRDGEPEAAWLDRVRKDGRSVSSAAAEEGTRIHAAIESHFLGHPYHADYERHVAGVVAGIDRWIGSRTWQPERVAVSPAGYGTKADLSSSGDDGGDAWVLDFKGKDGDREALQQLSIYDEHRMQLAATRHALGLVYTHARCAIVFVSRTHPGVCWPIEVKDDELLRGFEMFDALLTFWKKKNRYDSGWSPKGTV